MVAPGQLNDLLAGAGDVLAGRRCLVALSGGPDSAAAAWLAVQRAAEVRAVHLHHGWPDSDAMAQAAADVANHLGVQLVTRRVVPAKGASPEAQARQARYDALFAMVEPDELIVVGHTRDDQAETVLFNVARGGGARGVSGIPTRRGPIVRPLLALSRASVVELVARERLPAVADPANQDPAITRNRIRAMLPLLTEALGTDATIGLARSGSIAADDSAALASLIREVRPVRRGDSHRLPLALLRSLSSATARLAILELLRRLRPYGATAAELARIESMVKEGVGFVQLAGGFVATVSRTCLVMGRPPGPPDPLTVWGPELGQLRWGSWQFDARLIDGRPSALPLSERSVAFDESVLEAGPLLLRAPTPHDHMLMASGHKNVRQAIAEGGETRLDRAGHPIMAAGDTVLWVPGVRRSALGWVSDATARYLFVRIVEEGAWKSERC